MKVSFLPDAQVVDYLAENPNAPSGPAWRIVTYSDPESGLIIHEVYRAYYEVHAVDADPEVGPEPPEVMLGPWSQVAAGFGPPGGVWPTPENGDELFKEVIAKYKTVEDQTEIERLRDHVLVKRIREVTAIMRAFNQREATGS